MMLDASEPAFLVDGKWAPTRTGDYGTDCEAGRAYAEHLLTKIQKEQNPLLFGQVVRAITEGGVYEGVEAGFCSRVGIFVLVR